MPRHNISCFKARNIGVSCRLWIKLSSGRIQDQTKREHATTSSYTKIPSPSRPNSYVNLQHSEPGLIGYLVSMIDEDCVWPCSLVVVKMMSMSRRMYHYNGRRLAQEVRHSPYRTPLHQYIHDSYTTSQWRKRRETNTITKTSPHPDKCSPPHYSPKHSAPSPASPSLPHSPSTPP